MIALGAGLALLAGCSQGLTQQQRAWLEAGERRYQRQDYRGAVESLSRFLAEVRDKPETARAFYIRGMSYAQRGRRDAAYADLRRAAAGAASDDLRWRADVALGTLLFEDGDWAAAARRYRSALEPMPDRPPKDTVLYRLALCLERQGQWTLARPYLAEIVARYSSGPYADSARRHLRSRPTHYAVQCGAFRTRANAERLCGELRGKGLEAYVHAEQRGRTPMYLVLVGRYSTYEQALSYQQMIRRDFVPDALVWP